MTRAFECKNCKTRFEADDKEMVKCPHCQSDNVEIVSFHISPKLWVIGGGIVLFVLCIVVGIIICGEEEITTSPGPGTEKKVSVPGEPPTIEINELAFEGKGYTFNIVIQNPPSIKTCFAVINPLNQSVISKSDDGSFKEVPYSSADGGFYTIVMMDASNDTIITSIDKPGFIKQASVATKMTITELQAKIDSRDVSFLGLGQNDYLSPDLKLKFKGLPADAVNVPTILSEVFEKLDMETWNSVKVTSLDYDNMNRIKTITMEVVVANDIF